MSDTVLVIGGGIAGIQASLDLAEAGSRVLLVERKPSIGGVMAVLDKNFPTLDCSICIEAPKMSEVDLHPNIETLSMAELVSVSGGAGQFDVRIRKRARYVTDACTRCGECTLVCPIVVPNEFDSGMSARKAIYTPIPQSVPGAYLIDLDVCLNDPPNYLPCDRCVKACLPGSIDFTMPPYETIDARVGAIIAAVGYDSFDPHAIKQFGYGTHPDILTAMEFERLVNSAGPTSGEIVCPSDGRHPEKLLFVLCVGSRDQHHYRYCSRFCCMYSLKHAYQSLDHGVKDVTVMYMDMRSFGKGFDAFRERTIEAGARMIRSRPATIRADDSQRLLVSYEDQTIPKRVEECFDMVVLANAVVPPHGLPELAHVLGIQIDEDGFLRAEEKQGGLVATTREGIYAAGCASGPKDIPDSVAEGSGAAAMALAHIQERGWPEPPEVEPITDLADPRVGVFVCHCGSNIAGVVDIETTVEHARALPDVVYASDQMFSCAGNTQAEIEEAIRSEGINRVVIAACSPKTHESIFRGVLARAGLNPFLLEMANIRNMDSWVHKFDHHGATVKANEMIAMAVEKARRLEPLEVSHLPVAQRVLVVGGGIAGMSAAEALARQGFETHLVEREGKLGGALNHLDHIAPAGIDAASFLRAKSRLVKKSGVRVHLESEIESISGFVGSFDAVLTNGESLQVGAVVMATGAEHHLPSEFGCGENPGVITNLELEERLSQGEIAGDSVTFISCVGSRQGTAGCSRYCCTAMVSQALRLKDAGKKVRVISKDIRTYTRQAEELYEAAMRAGVQFFRYDPGSTPQEAIEIRDGHAIFEDQLLNERVAIRSDLIVLVSALKPVENPVADMLKLARSEDGFLMELHPKLGPAETASQGIYLAGSAQGPKDVRESMAQAFAAAGKAGALLARGTIEKEPLTARVDEEKCIGCMRCVKACPFGAIEQTGPIKEGKVRILEAACMGCGTCAAECNFEAIDMPYFTKGQIMAQIDAALMDHPEEKCIVFTCNWCSYAGADLAGIEKRQYPTSARIVRTMCSARFEEDFVARAFEQGAGAVLVTGCRLTDTGSDCHYNYANRLTAKRFDHWKRKFSRKGLEPERLQLRWISAAEGKEFAEQIAEMDAVLKQYQATLKDHERA
ncbi:MAG: hydrogenase iron-sulfur subunit [Anaerolineales bacterium]|nr:hydrogenase iron-sulfur subunit [Anaerolineales bacterium]